MLGSIFYSTHENWDIYTSTFYSTQALLGCMYGVPNNIDMFSNVFTLILFIYGSTMLAGALGVLATTVVDNATKQERRRMKLYSPIDEDNDGIVGINDWVHFYINNILVTVGWNEHYRKYLTLLLMTCWVLVGVYYGMVYENWELGYATYYSVAAISGSGAAPPVCVGADDDNCTLGKARASFMTLYLVIGVPLFTLTLGQFSLALVERAVRKKELDALLQPLNEEEYFYACKLDSRNESQSGDNGMDFSQFLVMEMLRLKRFDRNEIDEIKELFNAIDYDSQGVITTEKLNKCHLFCVEEINNNRASNNTNNTSDNDNQYNTFEASQNLATTPSIYNGLLVNLRNQSPLLYNNDKIGSFSRAANLIVNVNRLRRNTTSSLEDENRADGQRLSRLNVFSANMRRNSVDTNNVIDSRKPFEP